MRREQEPVRLTTPVPLHGHQPEESDIPPAPEKKKQPKKTIYVYHPFWRKTGMVSIYLAAALSGGVGGFVANDMGQFMFTLKPTPIEKPGKEIERFGPITTTTTAKETTTTTIPTDKKARELCLQDLNKLVADFNQYIKNTGLRPINPKGETYCG